MYRKVIAKGNIHRSDFFRALLSDTQPADVPIVVSNDGFYLNIKRSKSGSQDLDPVAEKILSAQKAFTIPYRYNIIKGGSGFRRLSLTHPASQIAVVDFYRDYGSLICHYAGRSKSSLRAPKKQASTYFIRGSRSDGAKYKGDGLETLDLENTTSNPATFFAYDGVYRAFKFFQSPEYMRLEKRYGVMMFSDISKCFSSIYTHTLSWAVSGIDTAKDNTGSINFSNQFDRLMQSMNYNETNGICVGAEIGRLFAETILGEVDIRIQKRLDRLELRYKREYEFRRYVDDYFIFAESESVMTKVMAAVEVELSEFNLHLNKSKTVSVPRPFITTKSRLIRDADIALEAFFSRFIAQGNGPDGQISFPRKIRKQFSLLRSLLESVKSSCYDHEAGYGDSANYIIGALVARLLELTGDFAFGVAREDVSLDDYDASVLILLEAIYFFYNVSPTVPSSLRVAQAAIEAARFFDAHLPARNQFLAEQMVRWTLQFVRSLSGSTVHDDNECVPLEALNILIVLGEVGRRDVLAKRTISDFAGSTKKLNYFEIVSFLFCMKDAPEFEPLRQAMFERARKVIFEGKGARVDAESAHLALDLLACPYLPLSERGTFYNDLRKHLELAQIPSADAEIAVTTFEAAPWFVNWAEPSLLRLIRKKELSAVY